MKLLARLGVELIGDGTIATERHQWALVYVLIEQIAGELAIIAEEGRGQDSKNLDRSVFP